MGKEELYQKALDKYGIELQEDILIEECAELIKAIMKYRRHKDFNTLVRLLEEIVDVEILVEQMKVCYKHCNHITEDFKVKKLKRLEEILNKD